MVAKSLDSLLKKLVASKKAKTWSDVLETLSSIKSCLDTSLYRAISKLSKEHSLVAVSRLLDLPYQKIYNTYRNHNRIPLKKGRRRFLGTPECTVMLNEICKMRLEGHSAAEIAQVLNVPVVKIAQLVHQAKILKLKKIPPIPRISESRDKVILKMLNEGKTYEEIGAVFGISRQRIEQIRSRRLKGKVRTGATLIEVAEAADLTYSTVKKYVEAGFVKPLFTRGKENKRYFFDKEQAVKEIEEHRTKYCEECNAKMMGVYSSRRFCDVCSDKRKVDRHTGARKVTVSGWRSTVKQIISNRPIKDDEEWVPLAEASRVSGLSRMQLIWLRTHDALHVQESEHSRWGTQKLFAVSEVLLAGAIAKNKQFLTTT
jgi:DNA-binding CsgD family transcriptional regulator